MKKLFGIFGAIVTFVFMSMAIVSCGSDEPDDDDDDDDQEIVTGGDLWSGTLEDAKYQSDAALYEVLDNSDIASIELTASGNYIVMLNSDAYEKPAAASRKHKNPFARKSVTRGEDDSTPGIFGEFEKLSDNKFNLKGYGVLEIESSRKLNLRLEDGQNLSLNVSKQENISSNRLNDRFCRTWYVKKGVYELYRDNKLVDRAVITSQKDLEAEFVEYVIVTKAGTFVKVDWDKTIDDAGIWKWRDEKEQIFAYKFNGEYEWGWEQVTFNNNYADFIYWEEDEDEDEGVTYTLKETITCIAK